MRSTKIASSGSPANCSALSWVTESRQASSGEQTRTCAQQSSATSTRRVREWAAGIAFLALRPERPWKEIVYDWQPYLNKALIDTDVMIVGDQTTALVGHIRRT